MPPSPTNDFLAFAIGGGANVENQTDYAADPLVSTGVQTGVAKSSLSNKTWRQATFGVAALMQFVLNTLQISTPDDGNLSAAVTNITNAIIAAAGGLLSKVSSTQTVTAANNRTYYVNTAAITYMLNQSSTLSTAWRIAIFAQGGAATVSVNAADSVNGGATGTGFTVPQGYVAYIATDGAGNFYVQIARDTSAVSLITSNATLTPQNAGFIFVNATSGSVLLTLPTAAGATGAPYVFIRTDQSGNAAAVQTAGGSDVFAGGATQLTLRERLELASDSVNTWHQTTDFKVVGSMLKAKTGLSAAMLTALATTLLGANVDSPDGSTFNRQNTANAAAALQLSNSGILQLLTAAAGSNPITWSSLLAFLFGTAATSSMAGAGIGYDMSCIQLKLSLPIPLPVPGSQIRSINIVLGTYAQLAGHGPTTSNPGTEYTTAFGPDNTASGDGVTTFNLGTPLAAFPVGGVNGNGANPTAYDYVGLTATSLTVRVAAGGGTTWGGLFSFIAIGYSQ